MSPMLPGRAPATLPAAGIRPTPPRRFADRARPAVGHSPVAPNLRLSCTPAWHLARRASLAPTADIAAEIQALGTSAWIERQLKPATIDDSVCDRILATAAPWAMKRAGQIKADPRSSGHWWLGAPQLSRAVLLRAVYSKRVLLETVVSCLSDHLYVAAAGRGETGCTDHDIDVLRPHALGRYADLLHAAVTGIGTLVFLNNDVNSRDNINENLGRELLEIYTVGTGVYTQADVRESARILSGHTLDWDTLTYTYVPSMHSTGPVKVMGFTHANATDTGGPAVLKAYTDYLARHPRTAERLCRRLAVRFVSDTPSAGLVAELASVYLAADTNLTPVLRRLLNHPEFTASVGAKTARPFEWVAGAFRSGRPRPYTPPSDVFAKPWDQSSAYWLAWDGGDAPRMWPGVDGYPDTADKWLSSMGHLTVFNGAYTLASPWDETFGTPDWLSVLGVRAGQNAWTAVRSLTTQLTGWVWAEADLAPLVGYLAAHRLDGVPLTATISQDHIDWYFRSVLRLVFASPYARIR